MIILNRFRHLHEGILIFQGIIPSGAQMFLLLCIILCLSIIIKLIYRYLSFDNKNIPGLRPELFYGNLVQTGVEKGGTSLADALSKFQQTYGDVFQFYYFSDRIIVFNTVEDVQEIYRNRHLLDRFDLFYRNGRTTLPQSLISIRNDEWKSHARIVEPLLKRSAATQYFDQILKSTDELIDTWTNKVNANEVQTDVINQCHELLLRIMLSMSYGEENNEYLLDVIKKCNQWSAWSILNGLHVTLIRLYINYINRDYHRARQQIKNFINLSHTKNEQSKTFLQSLLRSSLSPDELLDEILLINTGVDGVAITIS